MVAITLHPEHCRDPASNFATIGEIGTSILVREFDGSTAESTFLDVRLVRYAGGSLTLSIKWSAATATSGAVVFRARVSRHQSDTDDSTSDTFDTWISATATTAPSAVGEVVYTTLTLTSADLDGALVDEGARIELGRNPADAGDNMSGDALVHEVTVSG